YRGPNGLLKAKLAGKLVIDMSTVRPDTMISAGDAVAQLDAAFVECPVGGSMVPAREGKLFGLVGGAKADVARATPLLEQLCRRLEHVGPLGAGATMKLAVNLPLLVYWQALGEALTICKPLNLPADRLIDILSDTSGAPSAMKGRGPAIAKVLAGAPLGEPAFGLNAAKKDLACAVQFGASIHAELPVTASALPCYQEAETAGLGDADATAVSTHWIQRKNRDARTPARIHAADGLARRPSSTTIDIHAHIVVPQAAKLAQPHVDVSRVPLAHFADAATKAINAQQEKDVGEVMTTIDRRLFDLDQMGIDIQVVAPAPPQCYYSVDPKIAEAAHRLANDGVAEYCTRKPDRFVGLGVVTLQEPELAVRELDYVMKDLKLKGVEILTNVDGQELSDPKFRPFFPPAKHLGASLMM